VSARIGNRGAATAKASATSFLLSLDGTPSTDDIALGPAFVKTRAVGRNRTAPAEAVLAAPPLREGAYRLIACADVTRRVKETSEKDNCRASAGTLRISYGVRLQAKLIYVVLPMRPRAPSARVAR
jgi:hypothetical protein